MRPCRQYLSFAGCAWAAGNVAAASAASDASVRMVRRISDSFENGWMGNISRAFMFRGPLMHVVPAAVLAVRAAFAMRHIMTQALALYVISATVRARVPAYLERTCTRRSRRTTL